MERCVFRRCPSVRKYARWELGESLCVVRFDENNIRLILDGFGCGFWHSLFLQMKTIQYQNYDINAVEYE